jgi:hypothetical protein
MKYYLVDYENTNVNGLNGITNLTDTDVVCIFYSENAQNISFGLHRRLNESKAKKIYQRVEVGTKNALDFQLSSYLGYIIKENSENQYDYYIVAKDDGYKALSLYWKRKKINVSIIEDISNKNNQNENKKELLKETKIKPNEKKEISKEPTNNSKKKNSNNKKNNNLELISKIVSSIIEDKNVADSILELIKNTPSKIHDTIVKFLASTKEKKYQGKGQEIYKAVKPYL